MIYSFNTFNKYSSTGLTLAIKNSLTNNVSPVVLCIGSDLTIGDSLGPLIGEKLSAYLEKSDVFIYGTLKKPVTAKEIKYVSSFIKNTHPSSPVIAIDAAVGGAGEIGNVKVVKKSLRPGSGANKNLGSVGDISIIGIVAERSCFNSSLFSSTRLNLVNKMSDVIVDSLLSYFSDSQNYTLMA